MSQSGRVAAAFLAFCCVPILTLAEIQEFHAYIVPEVAEVERDSLVTMRFVVDSTAMQFNGYELIMQWDPEIVAFEGVDEGSLMTDSCPNRFEHTTLTDSTITYTHVILCAGTAMDGPGELSRYRFRGLELGVSPADAISDPDCTFFDAGECVGPEHPTFPRQVYLHDGSIHVIDPSVSVPGPGDLDSGFRIRVLPNPTDGRGWLEIRTGLEGIVQADVLSVDGRRVWSWPEAIATNGRLRLAIPVRGDDGTPLASGVYFYRVQSGSRRTGGKILLVR